MQVSKTLDYAVRCLSYMASSKDENITIKLVAEVSIFLQAIWQK